MTAADRPDGRAPLCTRMGSSDPASKFQPKRDVHASTGAVQEAIPFSIVRQIMDVELDVARPARPFEFIARHGIDVPLRRGIEDHGIAQAVADDLPAGMVETTRILALAFV